MFGLEIGDCVRHIAAVALLLATLVFHTIDPPSIKKLPTWIALVLVVTGGMLAPFVFGILVARSLPQPSENIAGLLQLAWGAAFVWGSVLVNKQLVAMHEMREFIVEEHRHGKLRKYKAKDLPGGL